MLNERKPGEYYYPVHSKESRKKYENMKTFIKGKNNILYDRIIYIDMIPAVMIHLKIAKDFLKIKKL